MKSIKFILALLILLFYQYSRAQLVITAGDKWTDVMIHKYSKPGSESTADTNYSLYPKIISSAWTASGYITQYRSLLHFNLSQISQGTTITSATLYFYSDPSVTSSSAWDGNSQLSGSNAFYLEKITQNWSESVVTWNNQPPSTTTGRVWVGPSTSTTENIQIDITSFVQDWVDNPSQNNGLKMFLETELHYRSRTYAGEDHSNSALHPMLVIDYDESQLSAKEEMDYIIAPLNKSLIPSGILYDRMVGVAALENYDGTTSADTSSSDHFFQAYYELYESNYNNLILDSVSTLQQAADTKNDAGQIPIGILLYDMHVLDSMADENGLIEVIDGQAYDVAGRTSSPYIAETVVVGAPLLPRSSTSIITGSHTFTLDASFFKTNRNVTLQYIDIDFDDGSGVKRIYPDATAIINYGSAGIKYITISIAFTNGQILNAICEVEVASSGTGSPGTGSPSSNCAKIDSSLVITGYPFDASAYFRPSGSNHTKSATVTAYIYFSEESCVDEQVRKPIVFLDGFDPNNSRDHKEIYADYINDFDDVNKDINLGEELGAAPYNYDIIIVDYRDGGDFIERNGLAVIKLLEELYSKYSTTLQEDFVVIGPSMGALIGQYALAEAERLGKNLHTRLFISFDGPHQGANVPIGLQQAVEYVFSSREIFKTKYNCKTKKYEHGPLEKDFAVNVPSAKQMLLHHYWSKSETPAPHYYRSIFNNTMYRLGYPQNNRNVAIINGSSKDYPQQQIDIPGYPGYQAPYPSALILNARAYFNWGLGMKSDLFRWKTYAAPDASRAKTFDAYTWKKIAKKLGLEKNYVKYASPAPGGYSLDVLPGGYKTTMHKIVEASNKVINIPICERIIGGLINIDFYIPRIKSINPACFIDSQIPHHSFIPTTSAVDLQHPDGIKYRYDFSSQNIACDGYSPFDRVYAPFENQDHVEITTENAEWFKNEIFGTPNLSRTKISASISGPATTCTSATYTMMNYPVNSTFDWTPSNNLSIVSGQGTPKIEVNVISTGSGWVEAIITDPCGVIYGPIRKNIDVSQGPEFIYVSVNGQLISNYETVWLCPSYDNWVTADLSDNSICIDWYYSESLYHTDYCRDSSFDFDGIPFNLTLVATNSCGSNDFTILFENDIYCPMMLSVYPNPSTDELTVEMSDDDPKTSQGNISEIVIYDKMGNKIKKIKENARSVKFAVNDLKEGDYILHVQILDEIIKQHIRIER